MKLKTKHLPALATLSLVGLVGMPALPTHAQSRSERVDKIASMLAGAAAQDDRTEYTSQAGESVRATPRQLMRETMTQVDFDDTPARLALEIWSTQTGVPLVVNWKKLNGICNDIFPVSAVC